MLFLKVFYLATGRVSILPENAATTQIRKQAFPENPPADLPSLSLQRFSLWKTIATATAA